MATTQPSVPRTPFTRASAARGTGTGNSRRDLRPSRTLRRGGRIAPLFVVPFFALFALVILAPIGYAAWMSVHQVHHSGLGFGPAKTVFSGLANFTTALDDPQFRSGFLVIALYCLVLIPLTLGTGLMLALLLDSSLARARKLIQTGLFIPHAVPGVIAAMVWIYLYTPGISPVVSALHGMGIPFNFLHLPSAAAGMINLSLWEGVGYNSLVFYAALQSVPREILEAARIDGAGELRSAVSIKLPLIVGAVGVNGLFAVIATLQLFTEPLFVSSSTPAISNTWTPLLYIYSAAFNRNDYGLASAASLLLAAFTGALSFVAMRYVSRRRNR